MPVRVVENSAPSQHSGQDASTGRVLPPYTLLSVGRTFAGTQNVSSLQKDEAWRVNVRIQGCDLDNGYLCGTMEALNVPLADTPVVTFWEGELIDSKNYTFYTGKWEATPDDDIRHWSKFPSFSPLLPFFFQSQVEADGGKSLDLSNYPFVFMRWKEQYFVNVGIDCGLTIAGFYYVCFSCSDGSINGFYYDPNSSPFQKLELKSTKEGLSVRFEDEEEAIRRHCSLEEFSVLPRWNAEEVSNLFQSFVQREHKYTALGGYVERIQSSDELRSARFRGVEWILSAGLRLSLRHQTIFAAVNYLDRFLAASRPSRKWESWMEELISIACLSVASKFEEVCYPNFDEFQQMKELKSDRKFDPSTIKQMELLVLKVLDWKLNSVTSYSYVELLSGSLSSTLMARITDLLIHTLCDSKFLEHNSSVVAVSVLNYAVKEIAPMGLDISFQFLEALISEEFKEKIDFCSKLLEDHNAQT